MILDGSDVGCLTEVVAPIRDAQGVDVVSESDGLDVEGCSCGMSCEIFETQVTRCGEGDEVEFVPGCVGASRCY
jgi:myo-inositol-hexaphosphate 3-phosphohydrolase